MKNTNASDRKLLLAVGAFVVAGAVGIALIAGLSLREDESPVARVTPPRSVPEQVETPIPQAEEAFVEPALPEVEPSATVEPVDVEPLPSMLEAALDPEALRGGSLGANRRREQFGIGSLDLLIQRAE